MAERLQKNNSHQNSMKFRRPLPRKLLVFLYFSRMIVYGVSVKIDLDIHDEWLQWMREKHIPDVLATGKFTHHKLYKVLTEDETDGATYAIQYFTDSMSNYFDYQRDFAPALQKEHRERYADKFVAFRTLLREIE